jgi:hypothetical protein
LLLRLLLFVIPNEVRNLSAAPSLPLTVTLPLIVFPRACFLPNFIAKIHGAPNQIRNALNSALISYRNYSSHFIFFVHLSIKREMLNRVVQPLPSRFALSRYI